MGIGSPDPPQFVYDDEDYQDVFISGAIIITMIALIMLGFLNFKFAEARFITREDGEWFSPAMQVSSIMTS